MRKIGVLLTLLIAPCLARSIKPASLDEQASIQSLINQANEINQTSSSLPDIRDIYVVTKDLDAEERQPEFLRNRDKLARLRVELKALKTSRDKLYQQAVRKTLLAYDLVDLDAQGLPLMPTKTAVHPSVAGRKAHWIVVYRDDEPRVFLDNAGKAETSPVGNKSVGGFTGVDGITTLYGKFVSPADLALLIYHERVHYEQFTTKGVGDKLIHDEREEKAFLAEYQNLRNFGLSPDELKTYEMYLAGDPNDPTKPGKIREHHDKAKIERRKLTVSLGLWGGGEPPSIQPRAHGEVEALLEESKDFDSQLTEAARALIAKAKKDKEAAEKEERRRQAEAMPVPVPLNPTYPPLPPSPIELRPEYPPLPAAPGAVKPSYPSLHERLFKYIAKGACSTPEGPFERELTRIDWRQFQKELDKDPLNAADGLSACEQRVYRRLVEFGRAWRGGSAINADDVRAEASGSGSNSGGGATPPAQDHDPVWGRIGPIIRRSR